MRKNKAQAPFVNIGSSMLLVIFLVLCLVTFATLSLSSALSDVSFSRRMAERKRQYYEASNRAEEILAQIDERLAQSQSEGRPYTETDFQSLDGQPSFTAEDSTLAYQVPITEGQALSVKLALKEADTAEGYYQIIKWQTVSTQSWESEQPLQLMPSNLLGE